MFWRALKRSASRREGGKSSRARGISGASRLLLANKATIPTTESASSAPGHPSSGRSRAHGLPRALSLHHILDVLPPMSRQTGAWRRALTKQVKQQVKPAPEWLPGPSVPGSTLSWKHQRCSPLQRGWPISGSKDSAWDTRLALIVDQTLPGCWLPRWIFAPPLCNSDEGRRGRYTAFDV